MMFTQFCCPCHAGKVKVNGDLHIPCGKPSCESGQEACEGESKRDRRGKAAGTDHRGRTWPSGVTPKLRFILRPLFVQP